MRSLIFSKRQPRLLIFLVAVSMLTPLGCQEKAPENTAQTPPKPPLTLKVVVNEDLADTFQSLFKVFQRRYAKERRVDVEVTTLAGFTDAEQIASGEQKNDLWITPSLFSPEWTNNNLINLGAAQKDCTSYGQSPLALVTTLEIVGSVCDQESGCLWEALANFLSDPSSAPKRGYSRTLLITPPLRGPVEHLGWASLFHWEGVDIFKPYKHVGKAKEPRWGGLNLLTLPEYDGILERMIRSGTEEQYIAVAPVASLKKFQRENPGEDVNRLIPLPLKETESFGVEFALCTSTADWVTREKQIVIDALREFLTSRKATTILQELGYKTPTDKSQADEQKAHHVDQTVISISDPRIRDFVTNSWKAHRPPVALTIALDTSASLEEEGRIHDLKRVARLLVAGEPEDTSLALMTYSEEPSVKSRFGSSKKDVLARIDQAQPIGGSAVYDALVAAFELTERSPKGSMKRLVFFTDGGDTSSKIRKDQIKLMTKRRAPWREVDLLIVGLKTKDGKLDDVREIATSANGRYLEGISYELANLLPTLQSQ